MTEEIDLYVPAGHLLLTSYGENYRTGGCFVTLEPLYRSKLQELRAQIISEYDREKAEIEKTLAAWEKRRQESPPGTDVGKPPPAGYLDDRQEMFISAMIRNGWLLSVTYTEMHVGSYGDLDLGI